ncbi:MAG: SET domain-containing protein-lysine N-methyltransferase [Bryobacteraceae bacterium]
MKIAILQNSYESSLDPISSLDPPCDPSRFIPEHDCTVFPIVKQRAVQQIIALQQQGFDAVINLCDGAWHGDTAGIEVVQALEQLNIPFTGAGSTLYDPTREAMKMASHAVGVGFPNYVMVRSPKDIAKALARLRFPILVKHPQGYSSIGLTPASRVTNAEALRDQAIETLTTYGAALLEEFIEGPEYTVLVTEARHSGEEAWALQPLQFVFPPGESFKHFDMKWIHYGRMHSHAVTDIALSHTLRQQAALVFKGLGCAGYARCDFRADQKGRLYLLEINPNCAVFYPEGQYGSADLILDADPAGHRGFLLHQLQCALRRKTQAERPWQLEYSPHRGFGLYAARPIAAGEMIERYEERAATLVSRRHAERHWTGHRRRWFDQYAWPLTHDIHVSWSDNPANWRPINHSCDPNTWLDGLDVIARRPIPEDEELTLDYATFCGPDMEQFECHCGSPSCRRVITGTDHLLPDIRSRYRGHVSDYIRHQYRLNLDSSAPGMIARQNRYGIGVIACRTYRKDETLCSFAWGPMQNEPSVHSIQAGPSIHAEPRPFLLRYINHSCHPNVLFDIEAMVLRALRDIHPGDELSFFYPSTEWEMVQPFQCECGTPQCLRWIAGASAIPANILERYELTGVVANCDASR